ncbi:MAG: L,D-transpeptidase family protein [Proteobacteria bacterium]|nr:L,D-transpeptidase family protein [Pseudomonadota bacterium]
MLLAGLVALAAAAGPPARAQVPDLIGAERTVAVKDGETLLDIAVREGVGYVELRAANPGIDPWIPEPGTKVLLPTAHLLPPAAPRRGIVVNVGDLRLYYFAPGKPPASYPIGIGQEGWGTPLGATQVARKRVKPTWVVPASIRAERPDLPAAVPPGPDNPLGDFALDLGWPSYLIHGTNKPDGVGRRVSHGCIRLYPRDIERLFAEVPIGTPVTVVDQPVKFGWVGGELYLEIHPSQAQTDEIELEGAFSPAPIPDLASWIRQVADREAGRVDWDLVARVAEERRGVPVRITR